MAQFAVPDADTATGVGWSNSGFARLDEGAPGTDDVADQSSGNPSEFLDKRLTDVTDPGDAGHVIRARWERSSGARQLNGRCELWQGVPGTGFEVDSLNVNNLLAGLQIDTRAVPEIDAANITDYTDLYMRVYYAYTGGGQPSAFSVDFFELEVPDPAPAPLLPPRRQLTTVRM